MLCEFTSPFIQNAASSPITTFARKRGFRCWFENYSQKFLLRRSSPSFDSWKILIRYGCHLKSSLVILLNVADGRPRPFLLALTGMWTILKMLFLPPECFLLIYQSFFYPNFLYFGLKWYHVASIW